MAMSENTRKIVVMSTVGLLLVTPFFVLVAHNQTLRRENKKLKSQLEESKKAPAKKADE